MKGSILKSIQKRTRNRKTNLIKVNGNIRLVKKRAFIFTLNAYTSPQNKYKVCWKVYGKAFG